MFKRLLWLAVGVGFGFGASLWAQRELEDLLARFSPERVAAALGDEARAVLRELRGTPGGHGWRGLAGARSGRRARSAAPAGPRHLGGSGRQAGAYEAGVRTTAVG